MDIVDAIANLGFVKVGKLILDESNNPFFELSAPFLANETSAKHGWVYMWLEISPKQAVHIVYIGKAGKTLATRCKQHTGGFRRSVTGTKHAARIRAGIEMGKNHEVWVRKSDVMMLFGEPNISMDEIEEKALIQKFRPLWNSGSVGESES